ncbi:MAG: MBL fold metallo-hydrolase [Sediminispirochaetaceae bacterium]
MTETIHRIDFRRVNAYLVESGSLITMIDSGLKGSFGRVEAALRKIGRRPEDIGLIIQTHTHYDHTGNTAECARRSGARVAVQRSEAEDLAAGYSSFPAGATPLGKIVTGLARILRVDGSAFSPVKADLLVDEEMDLHEYGFPGTAIHTPSHSAGSMSLLTDGGACFPGDILFNIFPGTVRPPFADYPDRLREHWRRLLDRGARMFYPGHGAPFHREKTEAELQRL